MDTITPIQTVYNGYRFRSRLEARWAVFFDAIGMKYEYEPEGYDLGGGVRYLPDFYLPESNCFAEVKANEPTQAELDKMRRLVFLKRKMYPKDLEEISEEGVEAAIQRIIDGFYLNSSGIFFIGVPNYQSTNQIILIEPNTELEDCDRIEKKYLDMAINDMSVYMFICIAKDMPEWINLSSCIHAFCKKVQEEIQEEKQAVNIVMHLQREVKKYKIQQDTLRIRRFGFDDDYICASQHFGIYGGNALKTGCEQARQARFEHGETPRHGR